MADLIERASAINALQYVLDSPNYSKALGEILRIPTADTPQTESTGSPIGDYRDGVGAWQTETSKTIPLNEWLSFKEYVLEIDGEGGPRIFRIIPMSKYKLQKQELHTDCGWGEPK